jgi:hypothetical protein
MIFCVLFFAIVLTGAPLTHGDVQISVAHALEQRITTLNGHYIFFFRRRGFLIPSSSSNDTT